MGLLNTFDMLEELLAQNQFELLPPNEEKKEIRLVYLMNDAVESFLVFKEAKMTGFYEEGYEGSVDATLKRDKDRYILAVLCGDSMVTIFFQRLEFEYMLYDYGEIGHFWVRGYEYLRQLEYKIAILQDKWKYLGDTYCTEREQWLVKLAGFPPLSYGCYPSAPKKYIVPKEHLWVPDEEGIKVLEEIAAEAEDMSLVHSLKTYRKYASECVSNPVLARVMAKWIAVKLHRKSHAKTIDILMRKFRHAGAVYPKRKYDEASMEKYKLIMDAARKRKMELKREGRETVILREEPFITARDSIEFHVYLMIWREGRLNRMVDIETFALPGDDSVAYQVEQR